MFALFPTLLLLSVSGAAPAGAPRAAAARRAPAKAAPRPASAPGSAAAPSPVDAPAAATGVGAPEPATATRQEAARRPWWVGGSLGPGVGLGGQGGPWGRLSVTVGRDVLALDGRTRLAAALPLRVAGTRSEGAYASVSRAMMLDVLPEARLEHALSERVAVYGLLGLGVVHVRYGLEVPGFGTGGSASTGLGLRVGGGVQVPVAAGWTVWAEPSLLAHTAAEGAVRLGRTTFSTSTGASASQLAVQLGASWRLP